MLHRITGRAVKCGPAAISAIAGVPTHEAAAVIRRLFDRHAVNGVFIDELAADGELRRSHRRGRRRRHRGLGGQRRGLLHRPDGDQPLRGRSRVGADAHRLERQRGDGADRGRRFGDGDGVDHQRGDVRQRPDGAVEVGKCQSGTLGYSRGCRWRRHDHHTLGPVQRQPGNQRAPI